MSLKGFGIVGIVALVAVAASERPTALGKPGITPAPCPDQKWEEGDATFGALPGAKASFGRHDGGVYRVEVPDNWNGELVLWAHGYVAVWQQRSSWKRACGSTPCAARSSFCSAKVSRHDRL